MGGQSLIRTELMLMQIASKNRHDYYHLISGVDLPLKNQAEMQDFFEKNYGYEFIGITPKWAESNPITQRYKLHWFFQDSIGKKKNILYIISRMITKWEKMFRYKRHILENISFYGGPNWFSLTEGAIKYALKHEDWVKERFKNTICCDEIFLQTIIGNSNFVEKIYNKDSNNSYLECLRFARFNKSSPYVLDMNDYEPLLSSGCLFARKFGSKTEEQMELVDKIYRLYK